MQSLSFPVFFVLSLAEKGYTTSPHRQVQADSEKATRLGWERLHVDKEKEKKLTPLPAKTKSSSASHTPAHRIAAVAAGLAISRMNERGCSEDDGDDEGSMRGVVEKVRVCFFCNWEQAEGPRSRATSDGLSRRTNEVEVVEVNYYFFSLSLFSFSFFSSLLSLSRAFQMLPDASCLLPPLARHAAAFSCSHNENATETTTLFRRNRADDFPLVCLRQNRIVAAAAVELAGAPSWLNAALGPGLQCFEAASLGMPLEVRTERMGLRMASECKGQGQTFYRRRCRPCFFFF